MDWPIEKQLSNASNPTIQEHEISTARPNSQDHTNSEEGPLPTHANDDFHGWSLEEHISVRFTAGYLKQGLTIAAGR
jgi:hypothetical protein